MEIEGKGLIMNERGTDVWQSGREKSRIWEARRGQRPVEFRERLEKSRAESTYIGKGQKYLQRGEGR